MKVIGTEEKGRDKKIKEANKKEKSQEGKPLQSKTKKKMKGKEGSGIKDKVRK